MRRVAGVMGTSFAVALIAAACSSDGRELPAPPNYSPVEQVAIEGRQAVPFTLTTYDGGQFSLRDFAGKAIVLYFFAAFRLDDSDHPERNPDLEALQLAFERQNEDVAFLAIQFGALGSPENGRLLLEERGVTFPGGADFSGAVMSAFEVRGYPSLVFLDRDHRVTTRWTGPLGEAGIERYIRVSLRP